MLFTSVPGVPDGHVGHVAGRYRNGAYSDLWTDVRRCADLTFTAYAPACSCGWRAAPGPVGDTALIACHRAWVRDHLALLTHHGIPSQAEPPEYRSVPCTRLAAAGATAPGPSR
jgi:hypothetical protein